MFLTKKEREKNNNLKLLKHGNVCADFSSATVCINIVVLLLRYKWPVGSRQELKAQAMSEHLTVLVQVGTWIFNILPCQVLRTVSRRTNTITSQHTFKTLLVSFQLYSSLLW